jgi:outer membrane protein OmpA-like peptidoglycan-associated protein
MNFDGLRMKTVYLYVGLFLLLSFTQGCVATRDWVQERLGPLTGRVDKVEGRVSKAEGNINSLDGRVNEMGGRLSSVEDEAKETKAKTYKALITLANLRLERKLVLQLKEGATFPFNSSALTNSTKREIDGFLSDLKGDLIDADRTIFLVAGHTDSVGTVDYNYELGKKRAEQVAKHLILDKGIDPTQVMTVSYGEKAPIEQNMTRQGRRKNRRVEILVYSEGINSSSEISQAR